MHTRPFVWIASCATLLACGNGFEAEGTGSDSGTDATPAAESSLPADATSDLRVAETSPPDTGPTDTGSADTRSKDTGSTADTGPKDTGPPDAEGNDTSVPCAPSCAAVVCPKGDHCCTSLSTACPTTCVPGTDLICPG
jgi:hypothetical protein